MGTHSRFAPSATERETACPPSFLLSESLPDTQSFDSAHGTAAHHIGYLCLLHDHDVVVYAGCRLAVNLKGATRFLHEKSAPLGVDEMEFEVDDEMITNVQAYVDWVREVPGDHFYEVRVEHTDWCPDTDEWGDPLPPQFGTSDDIACRPEILVVTDLKYGKGVKVFAERNKQGAKYALGAWKEFNWLYNFKRVIIRIAQPRLDHFDVWDISVEELLQFGLQMKAELEQVWNPDAPFNPGEKQCKFCKVAPQCRALHDHVKAARGDGFGDEGNPALLTPEEMVKAWRSRDLAKTFYDALAREMVQVMLRGDELPGVKLVTGVTHRRWKDEGEVKTALASLGFTGSKIMKETLISPNQAEKLIPKVHHDKIRDLWEKPPGGPAIVDASDPREAYAGAMVGGGFDNEEFDDGFN